jgi:hypothetical protein
MATTKKGESRLMLGFLRENPEKKAARLAARDEVNRVFKEKMAAINEKAAKDKAARGALLQAAKDKLTADLAANNAEFKEKMRA